MSSMVANSGVSMMLKAMGVDPQALLAKGAELETMGKLLAAELQQKVGAMEARMGSIESEQSVIRAEQSVIRTEIGAIFEQQARMETMLLSIHAALGANLSVVSRLESSQAGITPAGDTYEPQPLNPQPTQENQANG